MRKILYHIYFPIPLQSSFLEERTPSEWRDIVWSVTLPYVPKLERHIKCSDISIVQILGWDGEGRLVWSVALPYVLSLSNLLSTGFQHCPPECPSPVVGPKHICSATATSPSPQSCPTWPWLHSHSAWLNPGHVKDWPRSRTSARF